MYQSSTQREDSFTKCVGRKIAAVTVDGERASISFESGGRLSLVLDGDCCSRSYFTEDAAKDAADLIGATITKVEEVSNNDASGRAYPGQDNYDLISWHFLRIDTDRGGVTLDWRNDSNGYYDGNLNAFVEVLP